MPDIWCKSFLDLQWVSWFLKGVAGEEALKSRSFFCLFWGPGSGGHFMSLKVDTIGNMFYMLQLVYGVGGV